jgi:alpha-L-rhamnosidase
MNQKHLLPFLLLLLVLAAFRPAVQLARLRCELLTNPEGINATAPRLS